MRCSARRALLLLAVCSAAVAMAGCGGEPEPRSAPARVAFVVASRQLNFSVEMAEGYRSGAGDVGGVQVDISGPDRVDGPRQVQLFQSTIASAPGGVSLFTLTPELFVAPLKAAVGKGTPVIAVDNAPPDGSDVRLFVGNDNVELGRMLADLVIDRLPPEASGTVVLGSTSPGAPVLVRRVHGVRQEFARRLPGVRVLGPFETTEEGGANLAAWKVLVKANPTALAFLGTGDADGWNLAAIRRQTGGTWIAGAFDLDPKALSAVQAGDLVVVSAEHFLKGAVAGRLQAETARSGKHLPQGWLYIPGLAVDGSNVASVITRQVSTASKRAAVDPQITAILSNVTASLRPLSDAG